MSKVHFSLILFIFSVLGLGFLFSRWWHSRVASLALVAPKATSVPAAPKTNYSIKENVFRLNSESSDFTGEVRFETINKKFSFTVLVEPTKILKSDLYLWLMTKTSVLNLGKFEAEKGGLMVSGSLELPKEQAMLGVAGIKGNQPEEFVLSGSLP